MPSTDAAPILRTERLTLRLPTQGDLDAFAAFSADEEAMKFLGGPVTRPVAWRSLAATAGSWLLQGFGMFSVIETASGDWLGRVGPIHPEGWPGTEVGWGLVPAAWGKGYATEAAAACMDFAFDTLGWDDIIHTIAPGNLGSAAVATRLGSTNRGPGKLPDPYADQIVDLWGQTKAQWLARRGCLG